MRELSPISILGELGSEIVQVLRAAFAQPLN